MRSLARNTDPITSHLSADRVSEFSGAHKQQILDALKKFGPMTASEISAHVDLVGHQILKRLSDLHASSRIVPTGALRASASGRAQRVWRMA